MEKCNLFRADLFLQSNQFTGSLPDYWNTTQMVALTVESNYFTGTLPIIADDNRPLLPEYPIVFKNSFGFIGIPFELKIPKIIFSGLYLS